MVYINKNIRELNIRELDIKNYLILHGHVMLKILPAKN